MATLTAAAKKDEVPIDVTWEDQQRICIFSRLHNRIQHLLKRRKLLSDDLEKLDDANAEVMICDTVKYVIGEAFVDVDSDRAVTLLEQEQQRLTTERDAVDAEVAELRSALEQLKALLYAKFGSQIYLEDNTMMYDKPGGVMHEVLRRALDELRVHNNPYGTISIVTTALRNSVDLPVLPSGRDYVNGGVMDDLPSSSSNTTGGSSSSNVHAATAACSGGCSSGNGAGTPPCGALQANAAAMAGAYGVNVVTQMHGSTSAAARMSVSPSRFSTATMAAAGGGGSKGYGSSSSSNSGGGNMFVQGFVVGTSPLDASSMAALQIRKAVQGAADDAAAVAGRGAAGGEDASAGGGASRASAAAMTAAALAAAATPHRFNRTQLLRLLLLRAEALSQTRQHEKALLDALSAVEMSGGQSYEAYFTLGRERRRLFHISDAVAAFATAEQLLAARLRACALDEATAADDVQESVTDDEFWLQRGLQPDVAALLQLSRSEYEAQEQAILRSNEHRNSNNSNNAAVEAKMSYSTCSTSKAKATTGAAVLSNDSLTLSSHLDEGGGGGATTQEERVASDAADHVSSSTNSNRHQQQHNNNNNSNVALSRTRTGATPHALDKDEDEVPVDVLHRCGMTTGELAMWRRLSRESHALLTMRTSHTVPLHVLQPTLTLLLRSVSTTRGAVVLSMENSTAHDLRLVGCTAPEANYAHGFHFPEHIPRGHCGLAMLQPRSWRSFTGAVCYEVCEQVCCFFYFESPLMGGLRCGVRFAELRGADVRHAYTELNGGGAAGIAGATTTTTTTTPAAASTTAAAAGGGTSAAASFASASLNSSGTQYSSNNNMAATPSPRHANAPTASPSYVQQQQLQQLRSSSSASLHETMAHEPASLSTSFATYMSNGNSSSAGGGGVGCGATAGADKVLHGGLPVTPTRVGAAATTTMMATTTAAAGSGVVTGSLVTGSSSSNGATPTNTSVVSGYNNTNNNAAGIAEKAAVAATAALQLSRLAAAQRAVKLPASSVWLTTHTTLTQSSRACGRYNKAEDNNNNNNSNNNIAPAQGECSGTLLHVGAQVTGAQVICFALAEAPPVRLRSVELLPALEYGGATVLKKVSAVSRHHRSLINQLPPPLFYGPCKRNYPDYCVYEDGFFSPWTVHDKDTVQWRMSCDNRVLDHDEVVVCDANDTQHVILCMLTEAQSRTNATVFLGDRRCALLQVRESWMPFSRVLYVCTSSGRTVASIASPGAGVFVLTLELATASNNNNSNSGGGSSNNNTGGGGKSTVVYTARKRTAAGGGGGGSHAAAGAVYNSGNNGGNDAVLSAARARAAASSVASRATATVAQLFSSLGGGGGGNANTNNNGSANKSNEADRRQQQQGDAASRRVGGSSSSSNSHVMSSAEQWARWGVVTAGGNSDAHDNSSSSSNAGKGVVVAVSTATSAPVQGRPVTSPSTCTPAAHVPYPATATSITSNNSSSAFAPAATAASTSNAAAPGVASALSQPLPATARTEQYTIWRSRPQGAQTASATAAAAAAAVSASAVAAAGNALSSVTVATTHASRLTSSSSNSGGGGEAAVSSGGGGGADVVAEASITVQNMLPPYIRNVTMAELSLHTGADALLVSLLTFCIARWE